jgi:hypothetical protein
MLRELEVWEMEEVVGGEPGKVCVGFGVMFCVNARGDSSVIINTPVFKAEFSLQTREDNIGQGNLNQWAWGEAIRRHGYDGGIYYGTNTAPSGSLAGYR